MGKDGAILSRLIKNLKHRGVDPLRPLLDEYLLRRETAPERHIVEPIDLAPPVRPPGRLSPSGLCGCEREAVFRFTGTRGRKRVDPDLELIFDDGNWRHHKWQAIFADMELVLGRDVFRLISIEERVNIPDLYVAGTLDVLIAIKIEGKWKRFVVEIKGISDAGFQFVTRKDAPLPHHSKQLVTYLHAVGVPRGILWYDNKNNQHTLSFLVSDNDEAWREVEAWCTSVVSHLERQRLPVMDPECKRGNLHFERCPYTKLCYGGHSTPVQLRRRAYRDFPGVEDAWVAGNEEIDA